MKITEGYMDYLGYQTYYRMVGECTGNGVRVRKGPGIGYDVISGWPKLNKGNLFDVLGKEGNWYRILIAKKHEGYVYGDYVKRK